MSLVCVYNDLDVSYDSALFPFYGLCCGYPIASSFFDYELKFSFKKVYWVTTKICDNVCYLFTDFFQYNFVTDSAHRVFYGSSPITDLGEIYI